MREGAEEMRSEEKVEEVKKGMKEDGGRKWELRCAKYGMRKGKKRREGAVQRRVKL